MVQNSVKEPKKQKQSIQQHEKQQAPAMPPVPMLDSLPALAFDLPSLGAVQETLNEYLPAGYLLFRLDLVHSEFFASYNLLLLRRDYAAVAFLDSEWTIQAVRQQFFSTQQPVTQKAKKHGGGKNGF